MPEWTRPDESGWHWLRAKGPGENPVPAYWDHEEEGAWFVHFPTSAPLHYDASVIGQWFTYIAPIEEPRDG